MGILENVVEHLTVSRVLLILSGTWVLNQIGTRIINHRRITRLGTYAPKVPSKTPFWLDFVYDSVQATLARKELDFWRTRVLGRWLTTEASPLGQRIIFTADPENIKAILATQFSDYGKGEPFHKEWKAFLGDSIFTTDGPQWHASRQLIRPQFTKDRVSDLDCFEGHMETLFRTIANGGPLTSEDQYVDMEAGKGKVVNMADLLFRYTLDVTTDFLLGADVKSLTHPQQEFANAFDEVQRLQNIYVRLAALGKILPKRAYWACLKVINRFVNQYIERTLRMTSSELEDKNRSDKGYTFLHALAGFTRDPEMLRDQLVAVLLAGRDTTAGTLSWTMYEMARTPHVLPKLRAEILDVVGKDAMPTYEHLKNMPYLRAVLNETLRLYPAVPYNVRLALHDTTLPTGGGPDGTQPIAVLKDNRIAYSTMVMQRHDAHYPPTSDKFVDPAVFSPERWDVWHPKPHYYIPFNAGPRICVGQQFALTEMSYVLCRLFQKFDGLTNHMHAIDGGVPVLKTDITVSPAQGVYVAFREAKD